MFVFYPRFNPKTDAGLFDKGADAIINTVNTRATSKNSRGVAGQVFRRHDGVFQAYQDACRSGKMFPGAIQMVRVDRESGARDPNGNLIVLNVATKDDWRDPSRLEWVETILSKLPTVIERTGIRSIAMPPPGCGEGGLDWQKDVGPRVLHHLGPAVEKGFTAHVFAADPDPERGMSRSIAPEDNRIGASRASRTTSPKSTSAKADPDAPAYAGVGARPLSSRQPTGTPPDVLVAQRKVGEILADEGFVLRSGAAEGCDSAFEDGCDRAYGAKEIFLPKPGFNGRKADGKQVFDIIPPELFKKANELVYEHHPKGRTLQGFAFHAMRRNGFQVLGPDLDTPSKLVICYTDKGKTIGGTGHAIRLAEAHGIPVLNMGDPFWRKRSPEEIAGAAAKVMRGTHSLEEARNALSASPAEPEKKNRGADLEI